MNKKRKILFVLVCSVSLLSVLASSFTCFASVWSGPTHIANNPVTYVRYMLTSPYANGIELCHTPEPFVNHSGDEGTYWQTYETGYGRDQRSRLQYTIVSNSNRLTYEYTNIGLATDDKWWNSLRYEYADGFPFPSSSDNSTRSPIRTNTLTYHWDTYYVNTEVPSGDELRTGIYYTANSVLSEQNKSRVYEEVVNRFVGAISYSALNADTQTWTEHFIELQLSSARYEWIDTATNSTLVVYPQTKFGEALRNDVNNSSVIPKVNNVARLRDVHIHFAIALGSLDVYSPSVINQLLLDSSNNGYVLNEDKYVDSINVVGFDELDLTSWLGNAVQGFTNTEIFPYVAVGGVVGLCITISIAIAILKIFAGG